MKTLPQLAREALEVQDACNLSGVARGFVRAIDAIRETYPSNGVYHYHPIIKLWADKIAHLTGTQFDWDSLAAYTAVEEIKESAHAQTS